MYVTYYYYRQEEKNTADSGVPMDSEELPSTSQAMFPTSADKDMLVCNKNSCYNLSFISNYNFMTISVCYVDLHPGVVLAGVSSRSSPDIFQCNSLFEIRNGLPSPSLFWSIDRVDEGGRCEAVATAGIRCWWVKFIECC